MRQNITVIFQTTHDKKVVKYCQGLGSNTIELPLGSWHQLAPELRLMCGYGLFFDSWLLIEAGEIRILNMNDCVVDGEGVASEIATQTGKVDLLLTQFSYADWEGNPDEPELRVASAAEKLRRVKLQIEAFSPTYVIPCASFVYFSPEENFFCNDSINTIRDAHAFIFENSAAKSIVLYLNDQWVVNETHDNEKSLAAYDVAYDLKNKTRRRTGSVPLEKLAGLSQE